MGDRDVVGRYGEDLAAHTDERAEGGERGALCDADGGAAEPEGEPRENDANNVRDVQCAGDVRGDPGGAVAVCIGADDGDRAGFGGAGSDGLFDGDHDGEGVLDDAVGGEGDRP